MAIVPTPYVIESRIRSNTARLMAAVAITAPGAIRLPPIWIAPAPLLILWGKAHLAPRPPLAPQSASSRIGLGEIPIIGLRSLRS